MMEESESRDQTEENEPIKTPNPGGMVLELATTHCQTGIGNNNGEDADRRLVCVSAKSFVATGFSNNF